MSIVKKISFKAKYANPIFAKWLSEWRDGEENSVKKEIYTSALNSLLKFPLPLRTGRECYILQGFNKKLCKKLDDKRTNRKTTSKTTANRRKVAKLPSTTTTTKTIAKEKQVPKLPKPKTSKIQNPINVDEEEVQIFAPNTFEIVLLIDTHELNATDRNRFAQIVNQINALCVNYEVRHLHVGDFAWICRQKKDGLELVLPYVMERKRLDDFEKSIKDGRFHEQKFRLKQSKIAHLMYLVENTSKKTQFGVPLTSLYQAATNTLLQDGFLLKYTNNLQETAEYIAMFTKILQMKYSSKTIMVCSKDCIDSGAIDDDLVKMMKFKEFNAQSSKSKSLSVSDIFIKQLLQLSGISVAKALAIVHKFPTPRMLLFAYMNCDSEAEKENLLSGIEFGNLNKRIGSQISRSLYQLFCK